MEKKKSALYLDCASGISGDMFAAAMIDLGADRDALKRALDSLPLEGFETEISRVKKSGIDCCDFAVKLSPELENHDHDMDYLYGPGHHHGHEHAHEHEHVHGHAHSHGHEHGHHHDHAHRGPAEIREILGACDMTESARSLANRIFEILGKAEAKAHGTDPEHVHFHEVGAVDSIVDITAAAVCFDSLNISEVYVSPMFEGSGTVRCAHGLLPVPVPAVANILADSKLQIQMSETEKGEFITPTGAAIAAAIVTEAGRPERFSVCRIGLGAGKRTYDRPNYLRAMLIDSDDTGDVIWKLESDIDDSTGEVLGYVMEQLMEAGARDAHYLPVYMKKNRPAWQLQVICDEEDIPRLEEIIFLETTTIGIRRVRMERSVLSRENREVSVAGEPVQIKCCRSSSGLRFYPDYDSVRDAARRSKRAFRDVFDEARILAEEAAFRKS